MHIILNHSSMVPIYEQLMEQIKSEIIYSRLKENEACRRTSDKCSYSKKSLRRTGSCRICYNHSWKRNLCDGSR